MRGVRRSGEEDADEAARQSHDRADDHFRPVGRWIVVTEIWPERLRIAGGCCSSTSVNKESTAEEDRTHRQNDPAGTQAAIGDVFAVHGRRATYGDRLVDRDRATGALRERVRCTSPSVASTCRERYR